jgi:hypothetical protein
MKQNAVTKHSNGNFAVALSLHFVSSHLVLDSISCNLYANSIKSLPAYNSSYRNNAHLERRLFHILFIYWKKWNSDGTVCSCVFWILPPKLCLIKNHFQPATGLTYFIFPLYHHQATHQYKSYAILWLFIPRKLSVSFQSLAQKLTVIRYFVTK